MLQLVCLNVYICIVNQDSKGKATYLLSQHYPYRHLVTTLALAVNAKRKGAYGATQAFATCNKPL